MIDRGGVRERGGVGEGERGWMGERVGYWMDRWGRRKKGEQRIEIRKKTYISY